MVFFNSEYVGALLLFFFFIYLFLNLPIFQYSFPRKYIRDNEREQLCKEAMSLCAQTLRKHVDSVTAFEKEENKRKLLLDVYKCYHRVLKNYTKKDVPFGKLLTVMYYKYVDNNVSTVISLSRSLQSSVEQSDAIRSVRK